MVGEQLQLPLWYRVGEFYEICPSTSQGRYTSPLIQFEEYAERHQEMSRERSQWSAWLPVSVAAAVYLVGKVVVSLIGGDSHLEHILHPQAVGNALAYAAIVTPLFSHCLADVPFKSEIREAKDTMKVAQQVLLQYVTKQSGKF